MRSVRHSVRRAQHSHAKPQPDGSYQQRYEGSSRAGSSADRPSSTSSSSNSPTHTIDPVNNTQDTNRPVSLSEDEVAASHAISRANWSAAEREAGHLLPPFWGSVPYPSVSAPGPSSETGDAQCGSESHRRSFPTVPSSEYSSTGSPVLSGQERVDFRNPAPCSPVSPGSARIDTHSYPPRCSPEATHSPAESHPPRDPKPAEIKPRRYQSVSPEDIG
jgi:hypothetical protein